ncbi:MAG: hypothetical protein HWD59_03505 [Coxiellaceae bacterium]|nr:MAG: hypothetical protein HWD59_03505 [Coxiellaceae bacterium]
MDSTARIKYLRIALIICGLAFICLSPLMILWPSGWRWIPQQQNYEQMIVVIYIVLGIFLIFAAKDPLQNVSLIWFTVWSSLAHGGVMLVQALVYPHEHGHLIGDVPALLLIGIILGLLTPRGKATKE